MKIFISLISFIFIGDSAQAGIFEAIGNFAQSIGIYTPVSKPEGVTVESYKQYNADVKKVNTEVETTRAKVSGLQGEYKQYEDQYKKALAEKKSFENELIRLKNNYDPTNSSGREEMERALKRGRELENKVSEFEAKVSEKNAELQAANGKLAEAETAFESSLAKQKAYDMTGPRIVKLENKIAGMSLSTSLEEFEDKIKDLGYEVSFANEALERIYDDSILSEYTAQKISKLLNSKAICNSVNQCKTSDQPSGVSVQEMFDNKIPMGRESSKKRRTAQ